MSHHQLPRGPATTRSGRPHQPTQRRPTNQRPRTHSHMLFLARNAGSAPPQRGAVSRQLKVDGAASTCVECQSAVVQPLYTTTFNPPFVSSVNLVIVSRDPFYLEQRLFYFPPSCSLSFPQAASRSFYLRKLPFPRDRHRSYNVTRH